ncbi:U3 small nucleolar ribonucleoprotein protein IMP4 isoform X2 [Bos indicus]|uniref:U3 small nucleolar ribonucleoprotein protein IMP4 isoform X2 n=1 Tax=Bos indicus TaxID=9915 RepID=A0ABM4TBZ4_BOSIN
MLRREARLRREYLYRKAREEAERTAQERKDKVRRALEENRLIPTELRREALALQGSLEFDDAGGEGVTNHVDDEYRWAGVEDPKVMITTSRDPSSRLKMFAKELKLVFPGAQRMNRGRHEVGALVRACKANGVTDLLVVHEHRGTPVGLIVSHLPFGPTAYFTLCNVVMRHDIPDLGTASEAKPHLIMHGFSSRLGFSSCCPRSLTYSATCSLCPKMTATGLSPSPTRTTTSPSGTMYTRRPTTAMWS